MYNAKILDFIERLADTGRHFRMKRMERPDVGDLSFLVFTREGNIAGVSKVEMLGELRTHRYTGRPLPWTEKRVLHIASAATT